MRLVVLLRHVEVKRCRVHAEPGGFSNQLSHLIFWIWTADNPVLRYAEIQSFHPRMGKAMHHVPICVVQSERG